MIPTEPEPSPVELDKASCPDDAFDTPDCSLDRLPFQLVILPLLFMRIVLFCSEMGGGARSVLSVCRTDPIEGSAEALRCNSCSSGTGDIDRAGVATLDDVRDGVIKVSKVFAMNCCLVIWWAKSATWRSVFNKSSE